MKLSAQIDTFSMIQNQILRCQNWQAVFFKDVSSEASLTSPPVFSLHLPSLPGLN